MIKRIAKIANNRSSGDSIMVNLPDILDDYFDCEEDVDKNNRHQKDESGDGDDGDDKRK